MAEPFFDIPYYHDYISPALARQLLSESKPVEGIPGLRECGAGGGLETLEALSFLVELYNLTKSELAKILGQRLIDRKFIDERVRATCEFNRSLGRDFLDSDYKTIIGLQDGKGRTVIGPSSSIAPPVRLPVAPLPEFLRGPHVTLFGPPDSAKMAINAMNSFHRRKPDEPAIISELVGDVSPMWGADDEDSKTPLRADLIEAAVNLTACFEKTISASEDGRSYSLAADHLALPIKRFPGLALPSTFLFTDENPIPLHLYDFALHFFRNSRDPRALVFYVPKLENEEEAAYIHFMIASAERLIKRRNGDYKAGSVRLMIVLENPRAILRADQIMDALHPFFAGASLGWHDYLASTARVFKEDSNYRIPVKADPGIVIKYIKESHHLLAETVGARGGICVGGMYGILPVSGEPESLEVTLKGFIKDVVTQLKRGLNGFWVAHPDFVRIGLALVEAWRRKESGDGKSIETLVTSLLAKKSHGEILDFIRSSDIEGLDKTSFKYLRSLLVADIKESDFIANNHPDEIRYNVFQSLQYLADWLSGNGCVALPTQVEGVDVRVMDDLATAERSRWEVWHEIHHGRFPISDLVKIAHEEMNFIRRDSKSPGKITQVRWDYRTRKWFPIAFNIMLKLMTDETPVEFATELLMPFTAESIRNSEDPWITMQSLDAQKFALNRYVSDFSHYFEICGATRFARTMALNPVEELLVAQKTVMGFSVEEIREAANFHGNIGDAARILDERAASEQGLVLADTDAIRAELFQLGEKYLKQFGFKFLISAHGKNAAEIRLNIEARLQNSLKLEIENARSALWDITRLRLNQSKLRGSQVSCRIEALREKYKIKKTSVSLGFPGGIQNLAFGKSSPTTQFEIASLSKTVAVALAIEFFSQRGISLDAGVNSLFAQTTSKFRLNGPWADEVQLTHLMNHTALNMHYVNGFPLAHRVPPVEELLRGEHGYEVVKVTSKPGTRFQYSGGGFLVLEHLLEAISGQSILDLSRAFLSSLSLNGLTFSATETTCERELDFPALAAGAFGTSESVLRFLNHLSQAFQSVDGSHRLSHNTAVRMLHGIDKGAQKFMGCDIGLGVFISEASANRFMVHQGANDGFRSLFIFCFSGPDQGKGFVIFCEADNEGVPFIAEVAKELLQSLDIGGVDFDRVTENFSAENLKQEEIVNVGYKRLLFDAFLPDMPEAILNKGPIDPLAAHNLATSAHILDVSNQKFARAENLISSHLPVFEPELFGRQGKIMDSWESVRHNAEPSDYLHLVLDRPAKVAFVSISTQFHDGNHAEFIRLEALDAKGEWREIIPKMRFAGHALMRRKLSVEIFKNGPYSQVKIEMYPDGGVSRLGLYETLPSDFADQFTDDAVPVRFEGAIPKSFKPLAIPYAPSAGEIGRNRKSSAQIDWASRAHGGKVIRASNEHYGPATHVISPFPPIHMFDGLESARSREPGHLEDVVIQLGKPIVISAIELDFKFFVNNNPLFVRIEAASKIDHWVEVVPRTPVKAYAGNRIRFEVHGSLVAEFIKLSVYPDGGVHRIQVFEQNPPA